VNAYIHKRVCSGANKTIEKANNDLALGDIIFGIIHEIDEKYSLSNFSNFHYACFSFEQCIAKTCYLSTFHIVI
jgi:hypothetical protein